MTLLTSGSLAGCLEENDTVLFSLTLLVVCVPSGEEAHGTPQTQEKKDETESPINSIASGNALASSSL